MKTDAEKTKLPVSVAIPTYRREKVLLDTLNYLLGLEIGAVEILVVDQTLDHEAGTINELSAMDSDGRIRWLKLETPSITHAMNTALLAAKQEIVLFLDDDIRPEQDLVSAHHLAHLMHKDVLVAGRVIQPWEEGRCFHSDENFHFAGVKPAWIKEFMGGNFSLHRELALSLGGFDENFVKVAYRFEAEFAHRFVSAGKRVYFTPDACVHHLKDAGGGTRSFGEHLTTWRPDHAVGAYYFALRTKPNGRWLIDFVTRPMRSLMTRHHLRRPWWIPMTLLAELRGMFWSLKLKRRGPKYLAQESRND